MYLPLFLSLSFVCSVVFARPGHGLLAARQYGNTTSSLTGDKQCSQYMCVSATVNGSTVEYVLSGTGQKTPTWMGIGFGTRMAGTEMVIMWGYNNQVVVSNRKATEEAQPLVNTNSRTATLSAASSSLSGDIKYAFTIPANSDTVQDIIYGFGVNPVTSDAEDAQLIEHYDRGNLRLDLTKPLSSSGSGSGSGSGSDGSGSSSGDDDDSDSLPLQNYEKLIVAHAVMCSLGFLVFLPAGALLARYWRTFSNKWFRGHWIIQFYITAPIIIVGVALGIQSIVEVGGQHLNDDHKKWGIGIFALYFVQCALGAIIHFFKLKNFQGRPPQNYLHAIVGLVTIALAMKQVGDGIKDEWPAITGRPVSNPAKIVWYIWIVLIPVLYIVGLAFLPRQYRQERASRQKQEQINQSNMSLQQPSK